AAFCGAAWTLPSTWRPRLSAGPPAAGRSPPRPAAFLSRGPLMKPLTILALVLILLAVIALGYQGYAYVTTRERGLDIPGVGSVSRDRTQAVPLAPLLAGTALVAGIILLVVSAGRSRTL